MSNNLVAERRTFLKKRFISSIIQLSVVFAWTLYNCVAEIFFPASALPISFYLPQFVVAMASAAVKNRVKFILLLILAAISLLLLAACLIMARRNYRLVGLLNIVVSIDMILLIYISLQSLAAKSFNLAFVINLLVHIWMLALVIRLRRASEGLEVLPEITEENE